MQDCRFKPVINAVSDMIVNRLREAKDCSGSDMMDQRLKSHEKHMMKIKEYIQQKEAQEMSECTFEPMILPQSRKQ